MATQTELEAKLAQLEQRLKDMETARGESYGLVPLLDKMFPPEVRKHMRAARREQLLALRAYLDKWLEDDGDGSSGDAMRRESITVE